MRQCEECDKPLLDDTDLVCLSCARIHEENFAQTLRAYEQSPYAATENAIARLLGVCQREAP